MDKDMLSRGKKIRLQKRRAQVRRQRIILFTAGIAAVLLLILLVGKLFGSSGTGRENRNIPKNEAKIPGVPATMDNKGAPPIDVQLLTVNQFSRPGTKLEKVNGIVVHYVGNPGTSAQANRNYFESLKDSGATSASSHYIIDIEGGIIQCIPTSEWAYASNERNEDTISIECCHPGEDGKFTEKTYQSLVELTSWLCHYYNLTGRDVIRHYDVSGKLCPKYFVENEEAWEQFRNDVQESIQSFS